MNTNVIYHKAVLVYIVSEINVASSPAPRLQFLTNVVDKHLPQVLLTAEPRSVLQYIISLLLQLNIESSNAQLDDTTNSPQHQFNRTLLRARVLGVLNNSIQLTNLQLIQQMAFALRLATVSICQLQST